MIHLARVIFEVPFIHVGCLRLWASVAGVHKHRVKGGVSLLSERGVSVEGAEGSGESSSFVHLAEVNKDVHVRWAAD
jgi:hypothetical protein